MRVRIFLVSLLVIITGIIYHNEALATVNIESMRKDDGEMGLHTKVGFSLAYTEGNTDVTDLKTTLRSDYFSEGYHAFLAASIQRGEKDDDRYTDKGFVHLRGIRPVAQRLAVEAFVQKEYNDFILLEDRQLLGGGVRITALERYYGTEEASYFQLYAGIGLMKEKETINSSPEETSNFTRSTNYLSCRWRLDERVNFSGTLYYQPRVSDMDDYRILFDGGFTFDITRSLAFTLSVNYRHDSEPPAGIEDYDLEITNGISLSF